MPCTNMALLLHYNHRISDASYNTRYARRCLLLAADPMLLSSPIRTIPSALELLQILPAQLVERGSRAIPPIRNWKRGLLDDRLLLTLPRRHDVIQYMHIITQAQCGRQGVWAQFLANLADKLC